MVADRLTLAQANGLFSWPEGKIAVLGVRADHAIGSLPRQNAHLVTGFKPDFDSFQTSGFNTSVECPPDAEMAVVFLPRSKDKARALIAQAVAVSAGPVLLDGQKTDGIDSILKAVRKRGDVLDVFSKAHGKTVLFEGEPAAFRDWATPDEPQKTFDAYYTSPGVFSADGVDPASAVLVQALPKNLGRTVADLGAGWGFLSTYILGIQGVETVHLVEAEHAALQCAKLNVDDTRAQFHWADATSWTPEHPLDCVVMNPPFHTSRAADPDLGRRFIKAAARVLAPSGQLWMVANRHLPYEPELAACFGRVEELAGDNRFKVLHASRPSRQRG